MHEKRVLDIHLLELISLRIGQINDCSYCIDIHHKELKHIGESDLRLTLLYVWEEVPCFSKKEKAVLGLAEELSSRNKKKPTKKTFNLLTLYFNEEEIYRLIVAIKKINTWTWLMKTFGYESEQKVFKN